MNGLHFEPLIAVPAIVGVVTLLACVSVFSYWRQPGPLVTRGVLATVRLAGIALLAFILAGPTRIVPGQPAGSLGTLLVLCDASASMLETDGDERTRFERATSYWRSSQNTASLSQLVEVRYATFDERARTSSASEFTRDAELVATGGTTNLSRALRDTRSIFRSRNRAGIVLLSDGRDTSDRGSNVIEAATGRGIPVHTVCVGSDTQTADIVIVATLEQPYALPGEPANVRISVLALGTQQRPSELVHRDGDQEHRIPLLFKGNEAEAVVPVEHAEPGVYEHEFSVAAAPEERILENNRQRVFVRTAPERIRVLLLEGEPHWDTKFIAQALRTDERIALTQRTSLSSRRTESLVTREGETVRQGFTDYDAVILGRRVERLLSKEEAAQLAAYIRSGGRLILARGRPAEDAATSAELDPLYPGATSRRIPGDIQIQATLSGSAHPAFAQQIADVSIASSISSLPPLPSLLDTKPGPDARVLLESVAGDPVLVVAPFGEGEVLTWFGQGYHRWALASGADSTLDGVFDLLWTNLVRTLVMGSGFEPSAAVSLEISANHLRLGDEARVVVTRRDPAGALPQVSAVNEQGERQQIDMTSSHESTRRFYATFKPSKTGIYRIELQAPQTLEPVLTRHISIHDDNRERLITAADPALMHLIARQTGGIPMKAGEEPQLIQSLRLIQTSQETPPTRKPVWSNGWLLVLLTGLFGMEWLLRKRAGID